MTRKKKNRLAKPQNDHVRAVMATAAPAPPPPVVQGERVQNTGADARTLNTQGMLQAWGMAGGPGAPRQGQALSQDTTLWANLRWYLVSNERQLLSQIYVEIGLIQRVIDMPVDDGLRGGLEVKTAQLNEVELAALAHQLELDDDINTAGQSAKWNRLYGGAGILILTNQDPEMPLDINALSEADNLRFKAVDMWELFWDMQNIEGFNPVLQDESFEFYSYYGHKVHKSRVLRLKGLEAPSFIRPRLRGWGYSIIEKLVRSANQYLKGSDLTFEVLDEFKVDIYRMKDLAATLCSDWGRSQVHDRVETMNLIKNYQNAIVLDKEDEYEQKQLTFAGLAEAAAGMRMQVACDLNMPITRLWGTSAAGFNSGEDDIEIYNAMVESDVRSKLKFHLLKMIQLKCQIMFGFVPDDLSIAFKPLRVLGAPQEEEVKTQKFNRILQALQAGAITVQEFRDCCNKDNLMAVKLEANASLVVDPGDAGGAKADNPGADRPASREVKTGKGQKEGSAAPRAKDAPDTKDAPNRDKRSYRAINSIGPYNVFQFVKRLVVRNSAAFDKASYEADGGDSMFDPRRRDFFSDPLGVDYGLWHKAKEMSVEALGEERWQFVLWMYQKLGGKHAA